MAKTKKYKLDNFFTSFGAAVGLSTSAKRQNNYFGMVCFYASIIDALLRLTLIKKAQFEQNTDNFDETLIYQEETDKPVMEKTIYKRALDEKIITKPIYQKLFKLYAQRNKIIHRYIISDIKTLAVKKAAFDYDKMLSTITERHRKYDSLQKRKNIGFAKLYIRNPTTEQMIKQILPKHKGL